MREKLRREIWNHTAYVIIIIINNNNNNKNKNKNKQPFSVFLIACFYTFTHVENQPDIVFQSFQAR